MEQVSNVFLFIFRKVDIYLHDVYKLQYLEILWCQGWCAIIRAGVLWRCHRGPNQLPRMQALKASTPSLWLPHTATFQATECISRVAVSDGQAGRTSKGGGQARQVAGRVSGAPTLLSSSCWTPLPIPPRCWMNPSAFW